MGQQLVGKLPGGSDFRCLLEGVALNQVKWLCRAFRQRETVCLGPEDIGNLSSVELWDSNWQETNLGEREPTMQPLSKFHRLNSVGNGKPLKGLSGKLTSL